MAWNPSPEVEAARDFGKKFKKQIVVIFHFDLEAGKMSYASYGDNRALCDQAREIGDGMWNAACDAFTQSVRGDE